MASGVPADALAGFGRAARAWFARSFPTATDVQARGWRTIGEGANALLIAPTGSGKTLAAFLQALDRLSRTPAASRPGVRVLYVSPLKGLIHDIERNLRAPLAGTIRAGERIGVPVRVLDADIRTADTPAKERRQQLRHPAVVRVTTFESLLLLLGSRARGNLSHSGNGDRRRGPRAAAVQAWRTSGPVAGASCRHHSP